MSQLLLRLFRLVGGDLEAERDHILEIPAKHAFHQEQRFAHVLCNEDQGKLVFQLFDQLKKQTGTMK